MLNGFIRVAAAVPPVAITDPQTNVKEIIAAITSLSDSAPDVIVFPEMSVTGYTCGDLFHNSLLLSETNSALEELRDSTLTVDALITVGAPVLKDGAIYNCAIVICRRRIVAVIPKTYIPNYNEFYEKRWWRAADPKAPVSTVNICGEDVPFGVRQLVSYKGVKIGFEICEDLWTPMPAATEAALQGAELIVNLSASDALAGKYSYVRNLVQQQSARCLCGYAYASAGYGESSTDLVFDGIALVAENGSMLAANERWQSCPTHAIADIDILAIRRDRMHHTSFYDCASAVCGSAYAITVAGNKDAELDNKTNLLRHVSKSPFVPADEAHRNDRCSEIVNIQAAGLARRLDATKTSSLVIGISGGLDSTLALLVAVKAFDRLGLDRKGIIGVTMPGFGTTGRTHRNAIALMEKLGVTMREISIVPAVEQHFKDIGHDASIHNVTYENAQARQRTYLLMDIANQTGGMVLGTGDLSELALGWATYNGDHMSMYGVNAGVPKTLVKYLVQWFATTDIKIADTLNDICDTPISPELIPAKSDGTIKQKTEDLVGPYPLHDFFLYYTLRYGFAPARIFSLALEAFPTDEHSKEVILKWLRVFYRRFFTQQFKRSCMPDGPKVGSVCLSPRGDWRMPSDATSRAWLAEIDSITL